MKALLGILRALGALALGLAIVGALIAFAAWSNHLIGAGPEPRNGARQHEPLGDPAQRVPQWDDEERVVTPDFRREATAGELRRSGRLP